MNLRPLHCNQQRGLAWAALEPADSLQRIPPSIAPNGTSQSTARGANCDSCSPWAVSW